MFSRGLLLLLLVLCAGVLCPMPVQGNGHAVEVPESMMYCGIRLRFTVEGRAEIQRYVDQYTKNYVYHQMMVDKASTYWPFMEDAFEAVGAPKDLMYIAIQESGLRGDAVSTSNAVGFWQMKSFTAREVGLRIDNSIDERKHIFRASAGAARYFKVNFNRYDNWLYAVISYYAGGTGAKPFTEERYYGANAMVIDEDLHWYAQKAIAHKIAYEAAIKKHKQPKLVLLPYSNRGELNVRRLAARHKLSLEEFRENNLWISKPRLPEDRPCSYYVPASPGDELAFADPLRHLFVAERPEVRPELQDENLLADGEVAVEEENETVALIDPEDRLERARAIPANAIRYPVRKEFYLGQEFILTGERATVSELAQRYGIKERRLRRWNRLPEGSEPPEGFSFVLVRPRKVHVHIAGRSETLVDVGHKYRRNPRRLAYLNRIEDPNALLIPGQKVYLKKRRPKRQPLIVYFRPGELPESPQPAQPQAQRTDQDPPQPIAAQTPAEPAARQPAAYPEPTAVAQNPVEESDSEATENQANTEETPEEPLRFSAEETTPQQPDTPQASPGEQLPSPPTAAEGGTGTPAPSDDPTNDTPLTYPGNQEFTGDRAATDTPKTPARSIEQPESRPATNQPENATQPAYHTVRRGETLWSISRKYDTSVATLEKLNQMAPGEALHPGDRLRVR